MSGVASSSFYTHAGFLCIDGTIRIRYLANTRVGCRKYKKDEHN